MMQKIKLSVIGASGYWGPRILKALSTLDNIDVVACTAYSDAERLHSAVEPYQAIWPNMQTSLEYQSVLNDADIDAIIVSTPAETHFDIVHDALQSHKHVFVEKPLCLSSQSAYELWKLAENTQQILFVDHTYIFSEALPYLKKQLVNEGQVHHVHANRTQMGIYRKQNVLWDLAPHDLSIFKYLFDHPNDQITHIEASGWSNHGQPQSPNEAASLIDTVFFRLTYADGLAMSAFMTWCSPLKARDVLINGADKLYLFENNSVVSVYDHQLPLELSNNLANPASSPWLNLIETQHDVSNHLQTALLRFIECVTNNTSPPYGASGQFAFAIVELIEKIDHVLK